MKQHLDIEACFPGDSQSSQLMRAHDWSATPLGPVEHWPQSLKIVVRILLDSRYAMWMGWGPEFTFFYNDAYAAMSLGDKHPWALGRSAREVWAEIWDDIGPRAESVIRAGKATWDERLLLFLNRRGFTEESYHTFSYSPVPDDTGKVGGLLCVVTEDTERTIGERRLKSLRELAARTTEEARSAEDACQAATRILAGNPYDLPFTLLYLVNADATHARLAGATGLPPGSKAAPPEVDLNAAQPAKAGWPFHAVLETGHAKVVTEIAAWLGTAPVGVYPEPPHTAAVLPLRKSGQETLAGFLVAGVSPRRPFDDDYRGFFDLLAVQIATAIANARAYEEERRRAESLAELDRAKTAFFSNVSHEFRTPLTLMLGPVEDALGESDGSIPPAQRERLEVVRRNGMRLKKLVNTLLDFSRIEAGRTRASYEPADLASLTAELASSFRSACEQAGLLLTITCPPLAEPVYVDVEMWEKIVLNLVSNAFKYTLEGRIAVTLRQDGRNVELTVADTGTGISQDQLPHLFERFHRVEGARGRTQEGSGIGLALVKELVRLHGGTVSAESRLGEGSTFRVTVPLGTAHLPQNRIKASPSTSPTAHAATTYVQEALRWLPSESDEQPALRDEEIPALASSERPRILLADDNADMRDYIRRLLSGHYEVTAVADGLAARAAASREVPDLVLSDVMMPGLDGFGLLRELRADPRTQALPVILLSARAGEEARLEGLQAGADDYLTKPFSAKELFARVASVLEITRLRQEALNRERRLLAEVEEQRNWLQITMASIGDAVIATDEAGRTKFLNPVAQALTGWKEDEARGQPLPDIFHIVNERTRRPVENPALRALREGVVVGLANHTILIARDGSECPIDDSAAPIKNDRGEPVGAVLAFRNVTERRRAEEAKARLAAIVESSDDAIISKTLDGIIRSWNGGAERIFGYSAMEAVGQSITIIIPAERIQEEQMILDRIRRGERVEHYETVRVTKDGRRVEMSLSVSPLRDPDGNIIGASKISRDITAQKRAEAALRRSEERLAAELDAMNRLHALSTRLVAATELRPALADVLDEAIRMTGADFGNIQLLNARQALEIIAHQGFDEEFLEHFREVRLDEGSCCAQAMAAGARLVIEDVELNAEYQPHRAIAARTGYRAVQSTPLKDRTGAVVGMLSTHYRLPQRLSERDGRLLDLLARHAADLVERFRFDETLRLSEARFRQLADAMPQLVWTAGPDGQIDYLNRRWAEFTGLPQTVSNDGWKAILHPEESPLANQRWALSLAQGTPFEMELRLFDKRYHYHRWHLVRTVAAKDESGRVVRWFGTGTDIHEQKRAEESSRYLAEASAELAGVVDYESTLQKVANLAVPYFADWSAVDLLEEGRLKRLSVAHKDPNKIRLVRQLMEEYPPNPSTGGGVYSVLRTGKPEVVVDITDEMIQSRAKDPRHLELIRSLGLRSFICVPLAASGKVLGALTFATAESGRTYTDADVSLATDLAHRAAVAIENTLLYQALREADRRKDEFLATLAHELRNPLAPIRSSLQILKLSKADESTAERSRAMMERQVQHLVRLVDDLLDVSRVMRGKIELRRERLELASIVARAVETVQPLVEAQGHDLTVNLVPESLPLDADPVRLSQVVGNLLTNAAKYTEPGGRIWLTAERDGDMGVLRVRDTGIGIAAEMLGRIFELFVQADHASTKAQGGLGIGLTLAKNLVEMHNGTLVARSDGLGKGSEFVVRLPLALPRDNELSRKSSISGSIEPVLSGCRLLIVDDNRDAANSLAMLLNLQGHEVRVAYSGMAALEMVKSYTPDAVFLDLGMPRMDGYEVARRLREYPSLKDVILAALTGWGQKEDRRRTTEAGFDHHLVKPPEPEALEKLLAELKRRALK